MNKNDEYFSQIKQAAIDGKLLFFVGAGVSALSGYPEWSRLVQEFEKGIDMQMVNVREKHIDDFPDCPFKGYSSDELLRIPQKFYAAKGKSKYNKILNDFFIIENNSNKIHDMMLELNPAHFITTNYDKLIEKACVKGHKNYSSISCDSDVAKVSSSNYILKVHGEFKPIIDGKDVVLKENDYINYDTNLPLINNLAKSLVATNTVVFIGYGLNDYNINQMLNWVKRIQGNDFRHYFVRVDYNRLKASERKYYEKMGMNIIDVTTLLNSKKGDYLKRYNYFMERLISENKWDRINDLKSSLMYINIKLSGLVLYNYIRRVDLIMVFDGDYYFYPSGKVFKNKTCEFDYFKEYIDYKNCDDRNDEMDELVASIEEKLSSLGIRYLLNWNVDDDELKKSYLKQTEYKMQNFLYENRYEDIKNILRIEPKNIEEKLQKGFYLSGIGEWEKAYEVYTEVISFSYKKKEWLIYFFTQMNRHFLSRFITEMNNQLTSGYSHIILAVVSHLRVLKSLESLVI
jgi:NAD-dependent SIR2 family protein deacetylase